jgi:hypothetical protein
MKQRLLGMIGRSCQMEGVEGGWAIDGRVGRSALRLPKKVGSSSNTRTQSPFNALEYLRCGQDKATTRNEASRRKMLQQAA